jgi:uncharacterized membrane protein YccF (DUF307 family)
MMTFGNEDRKGEMKVNQSIVYEQSNRPGCLIQLLWFGFVGWWFGVIWVGVAWLLMLSVIGMPIAAIMLNNVPQVVALRGKRIVEVTPDGRRRDAPEINILIRIVYFLLIGWWLSAIWLVVAYIFCLTIVLLPVGFLMFDLTPTIVTLKR